MISGTKESNEISHRENIEKGPDNILQVPDISGVGRREVIKKNVKRCSMSDMQEKRMLSKEGDFHKMSKDTEIVVGNKN